MEAMVIHGVSREVRSFRDARLGEIASRIEQHYSAHFERYAARLELVPIRISRIASVGEGVQVTVVPNEPKNWDWWGEFEADTEVRTRQRLHRRWQEVVTLDELEVWLRLQVERYLSQLGGETVGASFHAPRARG
jgi:hypothetical protein